MFDIELKRSAKIKLGFVYQHKTEGLEVRLLNEIRTGHVMLMTRETWERNNMNTDSYFKDYEAFTENEISEITAQGIALKNGMYIDFAVCAEVWDKANSVKNIRCVGESDAMDYSFTFYALPKPIMIKFIPKGKIAEFFSKHNTYKRFYELQKTINEFGYKTYDMS